MSTIMTKDGTQIPYCPYRGEQVGPDIDKSGGNRQKSP